VPSAGRGNVVDTGEKKTFSNISINDGAYEALCANLLDLFFSPLFFFVSGLSALTTFLIM
jgi:cobalamin biosynthesis protein CobD/CbiB